MGTMTLETFKKKYFKNVPAPLPRGSPTDRPKISIDIVSEDTRQMPRHLWVAVRNYGAVPASLNYEEVTYTGGQVTRAPIPDGDVGAGVVVVSKPSSLMPGQEGKIHVYFPGPAGRALSTLSFRISYSPLGHDEGYVTEAAVSTKSGDWWVDTSEAT